METEIVRLVLASVTLLVAITLRVVRNTLGTSGGIQNNWTLASPWVWRKTHNWASFWMNILAIPLVAALAFLPMPWAAGVFVGSVSGWAGAATYKSYRYFKEWKLWKQLGYTTPEDARLGEHKRNPKLKVR